MNLLPTICLECKAEIQYKKAGLDDDKLLLQLICMNGHENDLNGEDYPEEKERLKENLKLLESQGK